MFHELPWETHMAITVRERSHQDLVEEVVKAELNIDFKASQDVYSHKTGNCIQQLYTLLLHNRKKHIMRRGQGNPFGVQAFLKYKGATRGNKGYRSRTEFYWTGYDENGKYGEHKVRMRSHFR